MTKSYPTGPINVVQDDPNLNQLQSVSLCWLKSMSDSNGIQMDITIKPSGIQFTLIKKSSQTSTVSKQTFVINNNEYQMLPIKFQNALNLVMIGG